MTGTTKNAPTCPSPTGKQWSLRVDKPIEIGELVAYYRNGWRYGRLLATTAKLAHIKPAGCGAALWVPLNEVVVAA
jgi:hypothetical protein